jgi:hypothetical protein
MLALVNPDTGHRIVDAVLRSGIIYKGKYLDRLPDLLVVWNRNSTISAVASPAIGELQAIGPEIMCRVASIWAPGQPFLRGSGTARSLSWTWRRISPNFLVYNGTVTGQ